MLCFEHNPPSIKFSQFKQEFDNLKTEEENQESDSSIEKPNKKYRKNVMNVHCTEYGVVKRVARRMLGFRLKEYEEDHEGGVLNGEGN